MTWKAVSLAAATALCLGAATYVTYSQAANEPKVLATVNGKSITEADVAAAEDDLAQALTQIPAESRRRLLVEHLIETQLLAEAAAKENLDEAQETKARLQYYERRVLRDMYFEKRLRDGVTEADAKTFYDAQISSGTPRVEVRARHILVETEEKARELREKLAGGADFEELAKAESKDPGSAPNGGDLGFFVEDQMVEPFAKAAFALEVGGLSEPVQTQFGWHVIKVEEKRDRQPPAFDSVKSQIMSYLVQERTQKALDELRGSGTVEIVDAELKKEIDEAKKSGNAADQEGAKEAPKQ